MKQGTILNNTYRVLTPIGMGGLGEIYLGYHENLQKYVVIKKVKEHCSNLLNNRIEVDILKSLHHTYLPQVYDFIQLEDGVFTVMDYISGHDLKYYMDCGHHFPEEQLVIWMKQLCEVLEYLHSRKPMIIHCDIKPGNIMITEEGNICLIDFNISLDGENNKELVGLSSAYASPEQVKKAEYKMRYGSGDAVKMDERTDIYSVGAVFYTIMSGNRPDLKNKETIRLRDFSHAYRDSLANIVDKAMDPDMRKRFRSAGKMLEALQHQERWESEYLKLWKMGVVLDSVAASLGLVLICLMILGYRGMKQEQFFASYDAYMDLAGYWIDMMDGGASLKNAENEDAAKDVLTEGVHLLNQNEYAALFRKNPVEKAEILCSLGQASLHIGDYEQAEAYLEEALEYSPEDAGIYRDIAVAQAKQGRIRKAEKTLGKAADAGLGKADVNLLMAEIAMASQEYEAAWEYACQVAESEDAALARRASYYILTIGEKLGNTTECIELLQHLENQSDGATRYLWVRKRGEFCFRVSNKGRREYLEEAVDCYERIYEKGYASLTDLYNLASCYMERGQLNSAGKLLSNMRKEYPDEYKVPMRLAYLCYRKQKEIALDLRDYRDMKGYFEDACELCGKQGKDWKEDADMRQLEETIDYLTQQGWLD